MTEESIGKASDKKSIISKRSNMDDDDDDGVLQLAYAEKKRKRCLG